MDDASIPTRSRSLTALLDDLDEMVARAGSSWPGQLTLNRKKATAVVEAIGEKLDVPANALAVGSAEAISRGSSDGHIAPLGQELVPPSGFMGNVRTRGAPVPPT